VWYLKILNFISFLYLLYLVFCYSFLFTLFGEYFQAFYIAKRKSYITSEPQSLMHTDCASCAASCAPTFEEERLARKSIHAAASLLLFQCVQNGEARNHARNMMCIRARQPTLRFCVGNWNFPCWQSANSETLTQMEVDLIAESNLGFGPKTRRESAGKLSDDFTFEVGSPLKWC